MAPKPPPEPEPAAEEESDPYESQDIACSILDDLVAGAFEAVAEKARRDAVVPYVVSSIEKQMRMCLDMYFIDHDIGEPAGAANWSAGDEPTPVPIDLWSRGAVKQLVQKPAEPDVPETASDAVARQPTTPRVRTPGAVSSTYGAPAGSGGAGDVGGKPQVLVIKPPEGYVPPKPKKIAPIMTAAEKLQKRLAAEKREEEERLAKLQNDLKEREYTYDARGNIIVLEDNNAGVQQTEEERAGCGGALAHGLHPCRCMCAHVCQSLLGSGGTRTSRPTPRAPFPLFSFSHTPLPSPSLVRTDKLPAFQQQPRLNMPPEKLAKKKKAPPPARGRVNFTGTATFKQLDSLQPPVTDTMKVEPGGGPFVRGRYKGWRDTLI